jgi:hypothetical protein
MIARWLRVTIAATALVLAGRDARASSCTEKSESRAVGYATCSHFGMWDQNSVGAELSAAFTLHRLSLGDRAFGFCGDGKNCPTKSIGGDTSIHGAGLASAYGPSLGMALDYGHFRLGPRIDFGWGSGSSSFVAPGIVPGDSTIFYSNIGILLGARFSLGHIVFGADVFTGASQVSVSFSKLAAAGGPAQSAHALDGDHFSVNPEVSVLGYLHPYVGFGFAAGADVATRDEMHASVVFRFPLLPYEGVR